MRFYDIGRNDLIIHDTLISIHSSPGTLPALMKCMKSYLGSKLILLMAIPLVAYAPLWAASGESISWPSVEGIQVSLINKSADKQHPCLQVQIRNTSNQDYSLVDDLRAYNPDGLDVISNGERVFKIYLVNRAGGIEPLNVYERRSVNAQVRDELKPGQTVIGEYHLTNKDLLRLGDYPALIACATMMDADSSFALTPSPRPRSNKQYIVWSNEVELTK